MFTLINQVPEKFLAGIEPLKGEIIMVLRMPITLRVVQPVLMGQQIYPYPSLFKPLFQIWHYLLQFKVALEAG